MKPVIPFAQKIEMEKHDYIMTYTAADKNGCDAFFYIRCDLEGYTKMQNDWLNKIAALPASYGEIIYTDDIAAPDAKAKEFLQNWLAQNA